MRRLVLVRFVRETGPRGRADPVSEPRFSLGSGCRRGLGRVRDLAEQFGDRDSPLGMPGGGVQFGRADGVSERFGQAVLGLGHALEGRPGFVHFLAQVAHVLGKLLAPGLG